MAENEESLPNSPEDSSPNKPLTEEQEEALNKIMAELQGAKENVEDDTSTEDDEDATSDAQPQEAANGLTDEQEEALQKIMAEIEGTSKSSTEPDKSAPNTSITAEQEETLNKIVAELQDNAPSEESDKPDVQEDEDSTPSKSDETGTEDLSPEQEEALQKIMAEIDSKSTKTSDTENDSDAESEIDQIDTPPTHEQPSEKSSEPEPENVDDSQEVESSNPVFEELDLSEFESELQKVVSEAKKEANLDQKPSRRPKKVHTEKRVSPPAEDNATTSPAQPQKVDDSTATFEKIPDQAASVTDRATENDKEPSPLPPLQPVQATEPEVETEKPKSDPVEKGPSESKTIPLQEAAANTLKSAPKNRFNKVLIGSIAMFVIVLVVAMVRWIPNLTEKPGKSEKISTPSEQNTDMTITEQSESNYPPTTSHQLSELTQAQNDSIAAMLQNITQLRTSILDKIKEINDLRLYYEQGIRETEQELLGRISGRKFTQLKDAVSDQRIELGLLTIQRRKGYIVKLQDPFNQLFNTSEELLYLDRKANIFLEMIENTSGINLDPFEKQVSDAIERISATLTDLSIDQSDPHPDSLESIWQELSAKADSNQKITRSESAKQNATIWKEICSGNFSRKWALTQLNEKAAQCLLQWDGKDLYLNQLTDLSPEIAQILSHWQGEWLGLNGLETLSPEVARHLARWQGKRLSLNGLTELSPKATLYLSKWQGSQLELVGLKHIGQWENPKVQLFVSDKLRSQIPK